MLSQLIDNSRTDKNTAHSYIDLYETLLLSKKHTAKNVLEIGIGDGHQGVTNGGSIKLWHDFFQNATIHALDIQPITNIWPELVGNDRIKLYTSIDAYNYNTFKQLFLDTNLKCDFILDDGPHTLDSMKTYIELYTQILTDNGILIIEDIPDISWIDILKSVVPECLQQYIKVFDLRHIKGRFDDIVFIIDKSNL
jgi:hypothetical protein